MSMQWLRQKPILALLTLSRFEYLWQDNENFKRPTKMPAPEYIEHLMAWVQSNVDNEQMFPSRIGTNLYPSIRHPILTTFQAYHSRKPSQLFYDNSSSDCTVSTLTSTATTILS
jgi:hypothetical protein